MPRKLRNIFGSDFMQNERQTDLIIAKLLDDAEINHFPMAVIF